MGKTQTSAAASSVAKNSQTANSVKKAEPPTKLPSLLSVELGDGTLASELDACVVTSDANKHSKKSLDTLAKELANAKTRVDNEYKEHNENLTTKLEEKLAARKAELIKKYNIEIIIELKKKKEALIAAEEAQHKSWLAGYQAKVDALQAEIDKRKATNAVTA